MRRTVPALAFLLFLVVVPVSRVMGQMPPAQVRVATVEQRDVTVASRLVATVEPVLRSTLAAETAALLRERDFEEGDAVEAGRLLARLDDSVLVRQVAAARAAVRSGEAELLRAKLAREAALRDYQRLERLQAQGVATEKEFLDATNLADQSEAQVAVAEARLAEQQEDVALLELRLEKHELRAPFAGVVNRRYAEVGEWVQQGQAVVEVVQLDPLWVRTAVPEAAGGRLRVGDRARVTVDALGGAEVAGVVEQILPVADAESRTFAVRLRVDNPDKTLRPGMFARVTLTSSQAGRLVVPRDAVVNQGGRSHVVVVRGGTAVIVPVVTGAVDGGWQAVTPLSPPEGELSPGEQVVIRGNETVMPGQPLVVGRAD